MITATKPPATGTETTGGRAPGAPSTLDEKAKAWAENAATFDELVATGADLFATFQRLGDGLAEIAAREPDDLAAARLAFGEERADLLLRVGLGELAPADLLARLVNGARKPPASYARTRLAAEIGQTCDAAELDALLTEGERAQLVSLLASLRTRAA